MKPQLTFVKVGTMPGECVEVRLLQGPFRAYSARAVVEEKAGEYCEFRRTKAEPWQHARITEVRNRRLFLELV